MEQDLAGLDTFIGQDFGVYKFAGAKHVFGFASRRLFGTTETLAR